MKTFEEIYRLNEKIGDRFPIDPEDEIECEDCGNPATHWLDHSGGVESCLALCDECDDPSVPFTGDE